MITTEARQGAWSELLGPAHLTTSLVLAGGVGLHAVNIFLTTSLLPSALEEIGGELLYAWSTTVFMIASVISSTLVSRTLARRGPAYAYLGAFTPFVAGTLICALSPSMEIRLVGRAIQGFGGGLLAGLGYAVVQTTLPEHLWVKATAMISAMWGIGTLLGPAVGGAFAQVGAWRLAFFVVTAVGVAFAALALRALPRAAADTGSTPVPWASLTLLTTSTAGISMASLVEEPTLMATSLGVAAVLLALFIIRERTTAVRVLPASTYRSGSPLRWIYLTIGVLAIGTVSEAFTPLFGQRPGNLEPLIAGFLGAAVSLGWSVAMIFSANASRPATVRRLRTSGPLVLAAGTRHDRATSTGQSRSADPDAVVRRARRRRDRHRAGISTPCRRGDGKFERRGRSGQGWSGRQHRGADDDGRGLSSRWLAGEPGSTVDAHVGPVPVVRSRAHRRPRLPHRDEGEPGGALDCDRSSRASLEPGDVRERGGGWGRSSCRVAVAVYQEAVGSCRSPRVVTRGE